jgi:DNA invertase Pin-like site-specific DNA recombinase
MRGKLTAAHVERRAYVYVRQSTAMQVHEHVESTKRQYALVERAVALGWARSDVDVIDEDQGKSGASSEGRGGFARLAEAVGHGEAGAVLAVEVSRLARSSMDWQRLLQLCAVTGVVVIDEQGVYDPSDRDDRLLLDLKGTMSEAELHWLRLRLVGGRLNKARRGELRLTAPAGYVWRDGRFDLDPDEAVQRAVRVVFERFAIEPTIWAVVRWAHQTGFKFPTRRRYGDESSEVEWRTLTMGRLSGLLHNPTYAGVYAFGRKQARQVVVDGAIRTRRTRLGPEAWAVCIAESHPAYIDWETFVSNQERLRNNQSRMHGATTGAAKNGCALLTGIALCGRCGRRMRVDYTTHERTRWRYICVGKHESGQAICWSVDGGPIDRSVEEIFLATMVPDEIDLSIAVEREADEQARSIEGQWQARLEQARYEARRAERRYKAVDPDNRVVARTLEREWEARLQDVEDVEKQHAQARRTRRVDLNESDRAALRAIARDLPAVWRAETTTPADRKAMLRLVIEMIALEPIDLPKRSTRIRLQWRSGAIDERHIERTGNGETSASIVERVRQLVADGLHDDEVAKRLQAEGTPSARYRAWTEKMVCRVRHDHAIECNARSRHRPLPDRHPETGHYSAPGAARRFGVSPSTIKNWVRRGLVATHRERYGRYNAWWLDIDDSLAITLERLAAERQ